MFFPIKDNIPSLTFPYVNWMIILANIAVYSYQVSIGDNYQWFVFEYGLVPKRVMHYSSFLDDAIIPFFSHMFMHGGFLHLFSNMYILFIFGDNVEDRLGHIRYLLMYVLFGLFAGFSQFLLSYNSVLPLIGASGAVAGVMGAYLVFYPHAKIKTLLFLIIFIMFVDVPVVFYLLLWLLIQVINGAFSLGYDGGGGVAWWAHIGGFIFGMGYAAYVNSKEKFIYLRSD